MSKSIKTSILFFLLLLGSFGYGQNLPKKLIPNIGISNQTPIKNLLVGETFTAGDFPIKILEISGASGSFSGKGYVTVPYLNDTKIAVAFENIKINTNYQLIDGVVETAYDASWSNVQDVEPLIDIINELIKEIESFLTNYTGSDEDKAKAIEFHRQQDELSKTVIDNPNLELELKTKIEKGTENAQQSWVALENKVPCADSQKKDENTKGGPSFENDNFNKDFDCYKKSINETVNSIKEGALALDKNALDGKAVPPINQEKTNTKPPIQDVKITRTLLNEIQRACTVDDGLSIKIGMTKSMTKAGEFYAYCKANSGTFYYYKGDKYWYINGNWFLETSCNFETCIKTCVKINADGTGVYEEIALEQGEATVVTAANFVVKTILVDTPLLIFGGGTKASTITINAIGTIAIEIFNRREDITNNEALISQVALLITTHKLDAQTPVATRKLAQNLIEKIERAFKNTTLSKEEVIREVEKMMGKVVAGVGSFLAKSGTELKTFLNGLVTKPLGKTYTGKFYKSVSKNAEVSHGAKPDIISQYSIDEAWGRYDVQGESSMYYSKTFNGNQTEMSHYGDWNAYSTYEFNNVQIDNMLDLTDDVVRQSLGTDFDKLVLGMSNKTEAYEFTNVVGTWARAKGYKGLIVPGARGAKDYSNVIVFNQAELTSVLSGITPVKLK